MAKPDQTNPAALPQSFTDVLYLTNSEQMPVDIKRFLKQKRLSFTALPVDKFDTFRDRLDLVGTVIIDTEDLNVIQEQKLARIIETLEMDNIGVTLIGNRLKVPVKSFSLAPAKNSFSMAGTIETVSLDDLWVRISLNLAYRKKPAGIIVKPASSENPVKRTHTNKLAEQFRMTESLVDNLAEQLRLAGLVQRDFLPARLPHCDKLHWAATFMPAEWVSGDIYDVVRLDEDHIGFYVADAVGHSMPAALLTIFLKQTLVMRQTVKSSYRIFPPVEVIKNLNVRMAEQKLSGYQFATCCYCLLNTKTLELTYARAGHPYPVLVKAGRPPQQLEIKGPLLGVFEKSEYVQQTIKLRKGDKLLLHSDGAEPFIGSFDERTGFNFNQRFCEIKDLPIVDMFDKFNMFVRNHRIDPSEVDDITIVGLEVL